MRWRAAAAALALGVSAAHGAVPAATPYSRMDLPWWRARFEAKQAELHRGPVDLLWLGDSITQNWESDGPEPWRRFLPVWQRYYGRRHAVDLGFKGDATAHLLWRLTHGELDGIAPRAAVLLIGANNFGHLHWDAAQTEAGIDAILAVVHARQPRMRVLLIGVLPSIRSAWVDANTRAVNAALAARYGGGAVPWLHYVDASALFLRDGRVDPDAFYDPLLHPPDPPLHPTAETQARLAALIEPALREAMGER